MRFFKDGEKVIVARGLTLEEVQEHCNDPKTHGDDWFDGYTEENNYN